MFERNKALNLLRDGFKEQFALHVFESDKFDELLQELSDSFVSEYIPLLVDEEDSLELSLMLKESIKLGNY